MACAEGGEYSLALAWYIYILLFLFFFISRKRKIKPTWISREMIHDTVCHPVSVKSSLCRSQTITKIFQFPRYGKSTKIFKCVLDYSHFLCFLLCFNISSLNCCFANFLNKGQAISQSWLPLGYYRQLTTRSLSPSLSFSVLIMPVILFSFQITGLCCLEIKFEWVMFFIFVLSRIWCAFFVVLVKLVVLLSLLNTHVKILCASLLLAYFPAKLWFFLYLF